MRYIMAKNDWPGDFAYNFVWFCHNCGTELCGLFKYKLYDDKQYTDASARKDYDKAIDSIKDCPICGMPLRKEKGYFLPTSSKSIDFNEITQKYYESPDPKYKAKFFPKTIDAKCEHMAPLRERIDYLEMNQKVKSFVKEQDLSQLIDSVTTGNIKNSPDELKKYIFHLIQLENNVYSLCQHLQELYYKQLLNNRNILSETIVPNFINKERAKENATINVKNKQLAYEKSLSTLSKVELIKAEEYQPRVAVGYPQQPKAPILTKPGLFNRKKVEAENKLLTEKYEEELKEYRTKVKACDEKKIALSESMRENAILNAKKNVQVAKEALTQAEIEMKIEIEKIEQASTILLPSPSSSIIEELLEKEVKETEDLIQKTLVTRNKLYAYDIIFVKYRNVVALSSFYEYLISGRCTTLEGADGAYNIYENEIRLDHVIDQLDTVISSLEDIKKNQYMMYTELQKINSSLQSLNSKMSTALNSIRSIEANTAEMNTHLEHISKNSDVIAYNTAATAYYSKINAELTNSLGYMIALS